MVGKTVDRHLAALMDDYSGRVAHYMPFEVHVVADLKNTKHLSEAEQREREGAQIMRLVSPQDHVVLLDEHGIQPRSVELAAWLGRRQAAGRRLVFVIGGPYGFSDDVRRRADEQLSLSPLTFSHQMVRVIFAEQLYRACTILRGEPYHHE